MLLLEYFSAFYQALKLHFLPFNQISSYKTIVKTTYFSEHTSFYLKYSERVAVFHLEMK
jgi:hypothetical protein